MSDRAENLEAIEMRLKQDILQEASRLALSIIVRESPTQSTRFGGLILTHNEMGTCIFF